MTFPNCSGYLPKFLLTFSIVPMVSVYPGVLFSTGFPSIASCDVVVLSWWFSSGLFSYPGFVLPWVMAYRRSDCFVVLFWEMAGSRLFVFLCAQTSCYLGECSFKPCPVCFPQFRGFEVTLLLGDGRYGIISSSFLSCAWGKLDGVFVPVGVWRVSQCL